MSQTSGTTLDSNGYFSRNGARFVPVGVNYWPGSCGVEMWLAWPEAEIQHDLDVIGKLGLNSLRFFLRWQDFEPEAGQYADVMFKRLEQFLSWCQARNLSAQPSLFVGWMSGKEFWPSWRAGRNLFSEPCLVERAQHFAERAASVIAPYHSHLLGLDLGNELSALPDSWNAPPSAVYAWCETITRAIRRSYPHCLIVSGGDNSQVTADTGWRLGQQPGTDYYSIHSYPMPAWQPIGFDGLTDPLCQSLLPFYTQVVRAFGPVMVQEFGTLVTFGAEQQDRYLRAVLPACWAAGANGFLWWCLRDIRANVQPYIKNNFESSLGLVDAQDRVKPGLEYFIEFAQATGAFSAPPPAAQAIGLYLPKHFYPRENSENPGNHPRQLAGWLLIANCLLRQLGHPTQIVRGDQPLDPGLKTIWVPGTLLGADEQAALETWTRAGGRLIWHGPDPYNWGHTCIRLLGAKPVDYRTARAMKVNVFDDEWSFGEYPRNTRVEAVTETAVVLARDEQGLPALLMNTLEHGCVVYALPTIEASILPIAAEPAKRERWLKWYAEMLKVGI
jgi:hypothetical protein